MDCLKEVDSLPFLWQLFKAFPIKYLILPQKTFKNSDDILSIPGDLFDFIFFNITPSSVTPKALPK